MVFLMSSRAVLISKKSMKSELEQFSMAALPVNLQEPFSDNQSIG